MNKETLSRYADHVKLTGDQIEQLTKIMNSFNQPQEVVHKSTGIMKPLDIVRTPKGDIGIIGETNDKGTKASIDFIKGCNEGGSHNAWWSEGDGLVILDNLPRLLADAMKHPFGRGREDVEHFFGNELEK